MDNSDEEVPVASMDWYNGKYGYMHYFCPSLAICYENGRVQIMCNESGSSDCKFSWKIHWFEKNPKRFTFQLHSSWIPE